LNTHSFSSSHFPDDQEKRLEAFESKIRDRRKEFRILLLGPGWPESAKKEYRDDVKEALKPDYPQIIMIEEFTSKIPLDDKFVLFAEKSNLIAAILVERGGREGVSWELGFLEGHARGYDKASGGTQGFEKLSESVVVFTQTGAVSNNLITRMIIDGMLTKVEVRWFDEAEDLIQDLRLVCERKLHQSYRPDLWP
jgi:hypothetical protein